MRKREISCCWFCARKLRTRIGGGWSFAEIIDPDGHRLRVHHQCQPKAVGDGYKLPEKS